MNPKVYKTILIIIILASIVLRIFVIENTPLSSATQIDADMGNPVSLEDYERLFDVDTSSKDTYEISGHFYYIMYLYQKHRLCNDTNGQTYHPPVHYIVTAAWLTALSTLPLDAKQLIEGTQYIGLIYYIISLIIIFKLLKELGVSDKCKLLTVALYSFFPMFVKMATYIMNDYLAFVFMLWILLYLIKWNKDQSIKNTIIMSVLLGLGTLTKYNCIVMLVPIGVVFLKKLIENRKDFSKISGLILRIIIFGIIALFLSISYIFRCIIVLHEYRITVPLQELYVGDQGFWQVWGLHIPDIFILNNIRNGNVFTRFLSTSLYTYDNPCLIIGILNAILVAYMVYFIVKNIKEKKDSGFIISIITCITYFISFIFYNIKYPYACTSNARYILITLFLATLFMGCSYDKLKSKIMKRGLLAVIILFCLNACYLFI